MPIETFRITNAGPFDDITFEFDEHVNVFVGPNNSGKSTALLALGEVIVFPLSMPLKFLKGSSSRWEIILSSEGSEQKFAGPLPIRLSEKEQEIQTIEILRKAGYTTFIPSLRRSTEFRSQGPQIRSEEYLQNRDIGNIVHDLSLEQVMQIRQSRRQDSPDVIIDEAPELRRRRELIPTDAALVSDESVVRKMVDLDYAAYRRSSPQMRHLIEKVASVASEITEGFPIDFTGIGEDRKGLFPEFRTPDGDVPLDVLSQGTQSIIQWLAHFLFGYAEYYDYPEDLEGKPAILIVDEMDVHLHPAWQRRIIPALTNNFPNLQVFCSTHSPLMLAGLKEGQVQLLNRDADGKVTVSSNPWDMAGWSAEEILRSVLRVRDTIGLETARKIDRMGELSIKEQPTAEETAELEELRQRVSEGLLDGPASSQVESFAKFLNEVYSKQASRSQSSGRKRPRVRRRDSGGE